ncbi:MAG TPA: polysaccharide biosynthesis C-terminal domain-containing protein [Anaerolineae bacterium]|nr:polysaccharide biosynthesis C-terminal domain-containing protein [Anaerolineae bacterium]HQK12347.1 polysaccharide biosynthesis C-terminal domain-containing protein [Anaerolineae bacterium]
MKTVQKNIVFNVIQTFVPLIVWIGLTPLILRSLGPTRFGAWAVTQSVVGYMGILDLGIGPTVIKLVADATSHQDWQRARCVGGSALLAYGVLGGIAGIVVFGGLPLFMRAVYDLPPDVELQLNQIALVFGVQIIISLPGSVFPSIARGLQRYEIYATQRVVQVFLNAFFIIFSLRKQWGVLGVIGSGTLATSLTYLGMMLWTWGLARNVFPTWKGVTWDSLKSLTTYSFLVFILQVSGVVIFSTSKIILGAVTSLDAVTVYDVASRIFDYLRTMTTALTDALMPAAASLQAMGEEQKVRKLFADGVSSMVTFFLLVAVPLFALAPLVTLAWVGEEIGVQSGLVLRILLIGFGAYCLTRVPMTVLMGTGKIKVYAIVRAISILFIPLLVWGGAWKFGVIGVAIASSVGLLLIDGYLFVYACKLFKESIWTPLKDNLLLLLSAFFATIVAIFLSHFLVSQPWNIWLHIVITGFIWVGVFGGLSSAGYTLKLWHLPQLVNALPFVHGQSEREF